MENLLVIKQQPREDLVQALQTIYADYCLPDKKLIIFLERSGVLWLEDEFWPLIYRSDIIYYVNVNDAELYRVPFREETIFSGKESLRQLKKVAQKVIELKDAFDLTQKINLTL